MGRTLINQPLSNEDVVVIQETLSYDFRNLALLHSAFQHTGRRDSEFIRRAWRGDAALGIAVGTDACTALPGGTVNALHDNRSSRVSNKKLAQLVVRHKLYIYFTRTTTHDEERTLNSFIVDPNSACPKILADLFESIIGAVYDDSDEDIPTVRKVFLRLEREF